MGRLGRYMYADEMGVCGGKPGVHGVVVGDVRWRLARGVSGLLGDRRGRAGGRGDWV